MPTDTPHITPEQVDALVTGGLPADERVAVDAHLAACPTCMAAVATARSADEDVRAALAADRPPVGLEDRVIDRLRAAGPSTPPTSRRLAVAAAAAAAVIAAGWVGTAVLNAGDGGRPVKLAARARETGLGRLAIQDYGIADPGSPVASRNPMAWSTTARRELDWASSVGNGSVPGSIATAPLATTAGPASPAVGYRVGADRGRLAGTGNVSGLNYFHGSAGTFDTQAQRVDTRDADVKAVAGKPSAGQLRPPGVTTADDTAKPGNGGEGSHDSFMGGNVVRGGGYSVAARKVTVQKAFDTAQPLGAPAADTPAAGQSQNSPGTGVHPTASGDKTAAGADGDAAAHRDSYMGGHVNKSDEFDLGRRSVAQRPLAPAAGSAADDAAKPVPDADRAWVSFGGTVPNDAPPVDLVGPPPPPAAPATGPMPATRPIADYRKVIRAGVMAFDVDRFDAAADTLAKVVGEAGGFVATVDSQKLPNGKTAGTVTVRCPPERLDLLVLSLRSLGDLKSQQITAQDITKEYTDLGAELTADRAMQDRLLDLIKTGHGSIKDLLAAETELGTWRVKIEKAEGQLRYYDGQVGLSTLAVTLSERDIQQAAASVETETADMGVETDDVERARDAAIKAIDDAHGRVVEAELKRLDAGQLAAGITADVPPETAGATIDRLKQLGRVARLEVHRQQTATNGPVAGVRTERRPTRIVLSIYNLANVAPRRTTAVTLAAVDPEAAYAAVLALANPGGRVVTSNLDRSTSATGTVVLEVPPARLEAALAVVRSQGEVLKRTATENPDTQNTTDAKVGLTVSLVSLAAVPPRETVQQTVAAADVPAAYRAIASAAAMGRVRVAELNEQDRQNVSAAIEVDLPRADLDGFDRAIAAAGDTVARSSARSADADDAVDSAVRIRLALTAADRLPPRETTTLGVEVTDVDRAAADAQAAAVAAGGRVVTADVDRSPAGPATAKVVLDVPLARAVDVVRDLRQLGTARGVDAARDATAPAGPLAHARVEVDLATADAIVADRGGPWANVRHGLSVGLAGLLWSLQLIVVGVCLLGPWALVAYAARRLWRWRTARRVGDGV